MLRQEIRPAASDVERWTHSLIEETRSLLGALLPLADNEFEFLELLNGQGEIKPSLLTDNTEMQARIDANPGLRWKALNVKKHVRQSSDTPQRTKGG